MGAAGVCACACAHARVQANVHVCGMIRCRWALIWLLRRLRGNVSAVGKRDMFSSAAMATVGRALHADI
eukprot:1191312-Prymnesium_polylepis.1